MYKLYLKEVFIYLLYCGLSPTVYAKFMDIQPGATRKTAYGVQCLTTLRTHRAVARQLSAYDIYNTVHPSTFTAADLLSSSWHSAYIPVGVSLLG